MSDEEGDTVADDVLTEVLERGTVRIGARWDLTFEQFLHPETGEPDGVVGRVGRLLARELGVEPEFVVLEWEDQLPALIDGRVDLLLKHTNLPSRALLVEFSDGVLMEYEGVVIVRDHHARGGAAWLEQQELRLAAVTGGLQEDLIRDRFPGAAFVGVPDNDIGSRLVQKEEVDGLVADAGLFIPSGCLCLAEPDGTTTVVSRDASHPCVARGQARFLRWLDTFMDYHTRLGSIQRIIADAKAEHARAGVAERGWASL